MMPRTRTAVTALGVAALLGLTACGHTDGPLQGDTSPTPSGTASSSSPASASASPKPTVSSPAAAPSTEETAKDQAFAKVKEYWALEDTIINADKGKRPERIDTVAIEPAAVETREYAKARAASPNTSTGTRTVSPYGGWVSSLTYKGKAYPYGTAQLQVCNDMSKVIVKSPKGVQFPQPAPIRQVTEVTVVFDPSKGSWFVTRVSVPQPIKSC